MISLRLKIFSLKHALRATLVVFLFFLPWQTMWITREPILNGAKWEFGALGIYASEVLLWVVVILFMAWFLKERYKIQGTRYKFRFSKDRIFLLLVLSLISYLLLSIIWAGDKSIALQHSLHILEAFLLFFILWVGPLSFASSARWFIGGAVVQSILGIWQFATQSTFASKWLGLVYHPVAQAGTSVVEGIATGRWLRAYGAFPHPNVLGGYLVIALLLGLLVYTRQTHMNKLSRITLRPAQGKLYHVSHIILLTALFFTFSRSAWIAAIIVLLSYCFIVLKNKKFTRLLARQIIYHLSFIIILSAIFFPLVKTRFVGESIYEIKSTTERMNGYREAWQLFKQHPWRGVGAGNYTVALQTLNPNQPGFAYQPVHNVGALMLVELGVVGLVLLLCVIVSFITYHISRITYQKMANKWYVLCGMCYVVLALFDHYLLSLYVGLMLSAVLWGVGSRFIHELSTE